MTVIYEGFFIDTLPKGTLDKDIARKHITTEFRPKETHESLYGTTATFLVVGYGNDGNNEGYLVKPVSGDALYLLDNISIPHITLSVSESGKPVNTKDITFDPH